MINELRRMEKLYETLASNSYTTGSLLSPVEKNLEDRIKTIQAVSTSSLNFRKLKAFISH